MSEHDTETDGDLLRRLGSDAQKWAAEFVCTFPTAVAEDVMLGWFASAIEVGRSEGYGQAKREHIPGWPVT